MACNLKPPFPRASGRLHAISLGRWFVSAVPGLDACHRGLLLELAGWAELLSRVFGTWSGSGCVVEYALSLTRVAETDYCSSCSVIRPCIHIIAFLRGTLLHRISHVRCSRDRRQQSKASIGAGSDMAQNAESFSEAQISRHDRTRKHSLAVIPSQLGRYVATHPPRKYKTVSLARP